jgi:HEAT repeat protein
LEELRFEGDAMTILFDDTFLGLVDSLCALDDATNGHPQVPEANRPQALAGLERLLLDLPTLDEHTRRLQKRFGRSFRHQGLLPEEQVERVVSEGAGVLSSGELAVLLLNPIALRDLAFRINEFPETVPDSWLDRLSEVGRQVMQAEGVVRRQPEWRRMECLCRDLATTDASRVAGLWRELTEGGALAQGCREAIAAGEPAQPTLERCLDWLNHPGFHARSAQLDSTQETPASARTMIAAALVAVLAGRCAAGEDQLRQLIDWACQAVGRKALRDLPTRKPRNPGSPFSWVHTAFELLDHHEAAPVQARAITLLHEHEAEQIVQRVPDPAEAATLRELLLRYPQPDGLGLEALLRWPQGVSPTAFPAVFPANIHALGQLGQRQGNRADQLAAVQQQVASDLTSLSQLLGAAEQRVRVAAAVLLASLTDAFRQGGGPDGPVPAGLPQRLARAFGDDHPIVRGFALRAVSRLAANRPSASLLARVGSLLNDPCPAVRIEATQTAARWQRITRGVIAGLAAQFTDSEAAVRYESACAVADLGPRMARRAILSGLPRLLADQSTFVAYQAARAARVLAGRMPPAIRRGLVDQLIAADEYVRAEAIRALGAAGRRASLPRVIAAIRARMEDSAARVRRETVLAWEQVRRPDDPPPTEMLARLLRDDSPLVRLVATGLVGRCGRLVLCDSIISGLADLLLPEQAAIHVRHEDAEPLPEWRQRLGPDPWQVPPRDQVIDCRLPALVAVGQLGPPAANSTIIHRVIDCLFADNRETTEQACRTIEQLGPAASGRLVERLTALLRAADRKKTNPCVQPLVRVGRQLCKLCGPSLLEQLLRLLNEEAADSRANAASALEWLGPDAAVADVLARLEELQDDPDAYVRDATGNALQRLRSHHT